MGGRSEATALRGTMPNVNGLLLVSKEYFLGQQV